MSSAFRFRKVDLLFVAAALAVVVGVTLLPSPRDRNPKIPAGAEHRTLTVEKDCLNCHVAAGSRPLPVQHPKRQDCFRCHARQ
ncbi:MAG: cytochrome c3 family protein [Nitrospiraceae bacterium]